MRKNYAHYHDAMKKMDDAIGASLKALEESGLAENTIVIHNSDHGGVLPRSKRYLFSTGLHCPLIIRIPEKYKHLWPAEKSGMKVDRLVSFIDNPEYGPVIAKMRTQLRTWQKSIHDSGLLPESEMVKRAAENKTTIYEMVRDPKLYNLPALLDAADLALAKKEDNLPALHKLLDKFDVPSRGKK